jgi:PhzF family phenazine biosynthesis protein
MPPTPFASSTFSPKRPLGGNPLAVFEDARGIDDTTMQALALQFNLSETTFILPSSRATAHVRIFTPAFEMPFAGHPTLGTAHVVRALMDAGDSVTLEMIAGVIPVEARGDTWTLQANPPKTRAVAPAAPSSRDARAGRSDVAPDPAAPPLWVDTGSEQLVIPLASADAVRRVAPRTDLLLAHGHTGQRAMAYVFRPGSPRSAGVGRRQNGRAVLLSRSTARSSKTRDRLGLRQSWGMADRDRCAVAATLRGAQGDAVGRPCRLGLEVTADRRIRVSGRVVELAAAPSRCRFTPASIAGRALPPVTTCPFRAPTLLSTLPTLSVESEAPSSLDAARLTPNPNANARRHRAPLAEGALHRRRPDGVAGRSGIEPVLGYDDARHLLARTGFGPTDAEVRAYATLTREAAVAKLLREMREERADAATAALIDTTPVRYPEGRDRHAGRTRSFRADAAPGRPRAPCLVGGGDAGHALAAHGAHDALLAQPFRFRAAEGAHLAPHVPAERRAPRERRRQFRNAVACDRKDPAMVVYLDSAQNRKGAPNENFAREVMELFTLGEGHYTEQDVKEAARAFTGWSLDRETLSFMFRPRLHDAGTKTVLGKSGPLDGDAVLDLLLARPETAQYVTTKLWREFVSPDPTRRK